jgi:hypothetical protein
MPKTHTYRPVEPDYLDTAPVREKLRQSIPASAAATFRSLEDGEAWPVWFETISKVTWTSERPFGVGTTRDIQVGAGRISETFWAWEDGKRMSFYFSSGEVPFFASFCEDYILVSTGDDSCELVWRYAFECRGIFRLVQPLVALVFKRSGKKALNELALFMEKNRERYAAA